MIAPCTCGRIHSPNDVHAVGRFRPGGPLGYRHINQVDDGLHPTRLAAQVAACPHWTKEAP